MLRFVNATWRENKIDLGWTGRFRKYYVKIKLAGPLYTCTVKAGYFFESCNCEKHDKGAVVKLKAWAERTIRDDINAQPIVLERRQKDLIQDLRNGPMKRTTHRLARSVFRLTWPMIHYMVEKDILKEDHPFGSDRVYYSLTVKGFNIEL